MKKIIPIYLMIMTSVFLITPNSAHATCSISDADPAVVTVNDNSCSVQPASYGITLYKMYLCTAEPTAPTTSAAGVYTSCNLVLSSDAGSRVDMTGSGAAGSFPGATFTRPPPATYTHGYILLDNVFYVKYAAKFNESKEGSKAGTDNGVFCATEEGTGTEAGASTSCGSSAITAGEWGAQLTTFEGGSCTTTMTESNLAGTGNNITGVLETSAGLRTSDCSDIDKLAGIQSFGTPIVVTKDLKSLNIAFQVSAGMTIWENGVTPPVINMGSGPFQAIITTTDY
jgi:hypothetical protein